MEFPKIQTANLYDQVYETLKQSILRREFRHSEKISIPTLAKQLGISITPIREALNRLETEGLVKTVPKVGTFVVGIDKHYVDQTIEIRLMIDYWLLDFYKRLSIKHFHEAVEKLDLIVRSSLQPLDPNMADVAQFGDHDSLFHTEYIRIGGNMKMVDMYRAGMTFRSLTIGKPTAEQYRLAMIQHQDIVKELKEQRWEGARQAIHRHLQYSRKNMLDWIENSGGVL